MFKADLNKSDIRLVRRLVEAGELTETEHKQFLESLEDSSDNVLVVDTTFGEGPGEELADA